MSQGRQKAEEGLLRALACGATIDAAAQQSGISRSTAHRRLADPEFCKQLQRMKADMVQRTTDMLTAAGMESVKNLLELQKKASHAVQLSASRSILEIGAKFRESGDLEKRLQALEEQLALNANNP